MASVSQQALLGSYNSGGAPIEVEYINGAGMSGSGSVKTATGINFGAEAPGRKLIYAVHVNYTGNNFLLNTATIGGVTADIIASAIGNQSGIRRAVWLIGAEVPTGTSGNVVATFSVSGLACSALGYRAMNVNSLVPYAKSELPWSSSSNDIRTIATDIPAGGLYIAASTVYHDGGQTTFSGVTPSYAQGAGVYYFGGYEIATSPVSNKTVSITKSGGAQNMAGGLIGASFR